MSLGKHYLAANVEAVWISASLQLPHFAIKHDYLLSQNTIAGTSVQRGALCYGPPQTLKMKKCINSIRQCILSVLGSVYCQYWAVYTKMFNFRRITLFCLEKRLSKHKMTLFGGAWLLWPPLATPMLWPPSEIFCVHHWLLVSSCAENDHTRYFLQSHKGCNWIDQYLFRSCMQQHR